MSCKSWYWCLCPVRVSPARDCLVVAHSHSTASFSACHSCWCWIFPLPKPLAAAAVAVVAVATHLRHRALCEGICHATNTQYCMFVYVVKDHLVRFDFGVRCFGRTRTHSALRTEAFAGGYSMCICSTGTTDFMVFFYLLFAFIACLFFWRVLSLIRFV